MKVKFNQFKTKSTRNSDSKGSNIMKKNRKFFLEKRFFIEKNEEVKNVEGRTNTSGHFKRFSNRNWSGNGFYRSYLPDTDLLHYERSGKGFFKKRNG